MGMSSGSIGDDDLPPTYSRHSSPSPNFTEEEVFVGDLSYFCTEQDLHNLFTSVGEIVDIRIRWSHEIRSQGHSLMYGFVKFRTAAMANIAIQTYNNIMFMGRYLK